MTKNAKIIIGIVAVLIIVGVYCVYKYRPNETPQEIDQTQATTSPELNPIGGQTVGEKIPETNPFKTQVNPYDSYKNPFN